MTDADPTCPTCTPTVDTRDDVPVIVHAPGCPPPARFLAATYDGPNVCPYCGGPVVGELDRADDDDPSSRPDLVLVTGWRCLIGCALSGDQP